MLPITDTRPSTPTDAPTLVASHSFGSSRREWTEVADLLADEHRLVAIDAPGFGDARDVPGYSLQEMAEQFARTVDELDLDRYVLVGHSMTGKVMSILASRMGPGLGLRKEPEKLVLLTPTPLGREVGGEGLRHALLAQRRDREDAEDHLRTNPAAWAAWLDPGVYEDWIERAAPIAVQTLVIAADRDPVWGIDRQQQLTMPHLQDATTTTIDSGHLVPLEAPEQGTLYDFLQDGAVAWAERSGFVAQVDGGRLIGPFNAFLRSPAISRGYNDLVRVETAHTELSARVREVVILTVGVEWQADDEIYAHTAVARSVGVPEAVLDGVLAGVTTGDSSAEEAAAHAFTRALVHSREVDDAAYAQAESLFGTKGVVDMVHLIGLYLGTCALLNAFEVPAPSASSARGVHGRSSPPA